MRFHRKKKVQTFITGARHIMNGIRLTFFNIILLIYFNTNNCKSPQALFFKKKSPFNQEIKLSLIF